MFVSWWNIGHLTDVHDMQLKRNIHKTFLSVNVMPFCLFEGGHERFDWPYFVNLLKRAIWSCSCQQIKYDFLPCKLQILISRTLKYFNAVSEISNFKNESAESYFNIFHEYAFINRSFFKTVIRIQMILKLIWNPDLFPINIQ